MTPRLSAAWVCIAFAATPAAGIGVEIDFNRDVRPILADHCFACHGPDAKTRKAKLRLDTKDGLAGVIVPGKPDDSDLIERVTSSDTDTLMPPAAFHKPLTPEKVATLRKWVASGAAWNPHWALVAPTRPKLPYGLTAGTSIDRFVLSRLRREGLTPAPPADRPTWLRRVTLDLTGLPPTPAEIDAFLADPSAKAFEQVVDRLLASPRYGEHMARYWLDAARYGDTHGLHLDNYREMWPYREWVIGAFNRNVPYDRFVTEQLAGDLLPNPTTDQQIATGFLRCHVTTSEGGSIEEEVYVRNVADQVDTFGTVLFGLTVGCARCHDHKYDPVSTREYYSLFAFFNSIDGSPLDGNAARHAPVLRLPTPAQAAERDRIGSDLAAVEKRTADAVAKVEYDADPAAVAAKPAARREVVWIDDALPPGATATVGGQNLTWDFVPKADHPTASGERSVKLAASGLNQVVLSGAKPGLRVGDGDRLFAHVFIDPKDPPKELMLQWHTAAGWMHRAYWGENHIPWGTDRSPERLPKGELPNAGTWVRLEATAAEVGIKAGGVIDGWAFTQYGGTAYWDKSGVVTQTPQGELRFDTLAEWAAARGADTGVPAGVRDAVKLAPEKRTDAQKQRLRDYFVEHGYTKTRDTFDPLHTARAALTAAAAELDGKIAATLVFKEKGTPRPAFVLTRGEYEQRGAKIDRVTPAAMPRFPADAPANRLGLAKWLTRPDHPLTARVAVNRFWQQAFGTGLVKTADDFGTQGEPPSHPELLDWLAVEFRESGWDIKKLMRSLVLSDTYRQSAAVTPEKLARDPHNRLLSRGPRFRLDAEVVRDQALFAGGLLVERVGGPSVKPPQPGGLWEAVGYVSSNTARFSPDIGHDKIHRRSVYTFWKRTAPPPQMAALDAPSRESCTVRRERTNTPLQALLLLNETQFVEAARGMAGRAIRDGGADRVAHLFKLGTGRTPDATEQGVLREAYREHLASYRANPAEAKKLVAVGESKADPAHDPAELAALTLVANVVLNLDEVLTK